MPTNAIGTGTCNLSFNVPLDERAELGRVAFRAGAKSVGDFLRALILNGLEEADADAARRVKEIRKRYYGAAMLVVFVGALAAHPLQSAMRGTQESRCEEIIEEEL